MGDPLRLHRIIELIEKFFVLLLAMLSSETEWVNFLDTDFLGIGLAFQDRHDFVDEFAQRHRPWIVRLLIAHQRSLHVRRDQLDDFRLCRPELVTE